MGKTTTTTTCGDGDGDGGGEDFFIQEILVCLPVKSLLRFKSVCKSWRDLIETPFFIDLHTTFNSSSSSSSKFGAFILQTTEPSDDIYKYGDDIKLYMLSSESGDHGDGEDDNNEDDDHQKKKKKKMVFKLDEDLGFSAIFKDFQLEDSLRMVGSCNGIICLQDPELTDAFKRRRHYLNLRDVSLWNPATRQFRILPKSIPIQEEKKNIHWLGDFIGFGFDVKAKDYKVLRITPLDESEEGRGCMCQVQVYSLSTDSWRLLEGINSLPCLPDQNLFLNSGIYLNGSYFFVGYKSNTEFCHFVLLSFDFTKEIFTTMQLPDDNNRTSVLSCLGDKLAVFTYGIDCDDGYDYYDIWVLNEQKHGSGQGVVNNENSWTKLHSFRIKSSREPSETEPSETEPSDDNEPRCISNNGEFALISTGTTYVDGCSRNKFQLFNLITKEAKKNFTIGTREFRVNVYKESLVSIMGGGNVLFRWQLPSPGTTYKLNLDVPFITDYYNYGLFGIGLCLTSDTGGCIGVRSLKGFSVRDATQVEALAMLEAIKWAKKLELSPIIIESNSKNCVSFFMDDDDNNNLTYWSSGAISLLREAKILLNSSELDISFQYCSRSRNYVADIAAKLVREGGFWHCKEWNANSPGEIVMSLSKDLGLESKNYWAFDSGVEAENYWASDSVVETDNYWAFDSGVEAENYWASYSVVETDNYLGFDSGLETEKGWASDPGLETEKGWASNSGLETDKGWVSE